jgi:hypothetical protein
LYSPPHFIFKERTMKTICLIIALLAAGTAGAQSISPIQTECGGKKCSGQFTATNLNLTPAVVTIRAVSWRPGHVTDLDPNVHLMLRDMSARLGPKGSHIFFFTVTADTLPSNFALYATFTPLRQQGDTTSVTIAMSLPHTVWLCDKASDCRVNIRHGWGVQ